MKPAEPALSASRRVPIAVAYRLERQVLYLRLAFFTPKLEQPAITQRDHLAVIDANSGSRAIDPLRSALEFREPTNRRFVDHAMPFAIGPFAPPLFIAKRRNQPQRTKDLGHRFAVAHLGLGLDAMLVPLAARVGLGYALVRQDPLAAVVAKAHNLNPRAQLPVRRVVENIALEGPRRHQMKPSRLQPPREARNIVDPEFDFGLDGHGQQ